MDIAPESPIPPQSATQLHEFFDLWRGLALQKGRLPGQGDLDLSALTERFPGFALLAVEGELPSKRRYRYMAAGPEHPAITGRNIEGRTLDEQLPPNVYSVVAKIYEWVRVERKPHYWKRSLATRWSGVRKYERVLVPLASFGNQVDALIGVWVWDEAAPSSFPNPGYMV